MPGGVDDVGDLMEASGETGDLAAGPWNLSGRVEGERGRNGPEDG